MAKLHRVPWILELPVSSMLGWGQQFWKEFKLLNAECTICDWCQYGANIRTQDISNKEKEDTMYGVKKDIEN